MTMTNRKSTTGETDSRTGIELTGIAQIDDARPDLVSTTQRWASLPLLRHEVLAAEADEHNGGRGLGIEPAHHAVWKPHHPHEALAAEHQTARHSRRAPKSRAELGAKASAASELRGHVRKLNGGDLGERDTGDQSERCADEEAGSRDEGARRADWASWARRGETGELGWGWLRENRGAESSARRRGRVGREASAREARVATRAGGRADDEQEVASPEEQGRWVSYRGRSSALGSCRAGKKPAARGKQRAGTRARDIRWRSRTLPRPWKAGAAGLGDPGTRREQDAPWEHGGEAARLGGEKRSSAGGCLKKEQRTLALRAGPSSAAMAEQRAEQGRGRRNSGSARLEEARRAERTGGSSAAMAGARGRQRASATERRKILGTRAQGVRHGAAGD
ncbi:uncharacterized protein LOC100384582 [Zea mays]|jgi:hypothetical protein|nr:uncharacterized protein LOC100384582 [Zea mays]ACR34054.1 unknown [Zea mays]AQK68526.1 hypothetical protein ZEAMMB73_Zm00001d015270 [Zea mays]|eukprot:NP_001170559.1 uncharacterized protein LOC100384582 [Zea mays]